MLTRMFKVEPETTLDPTLMNLFSCWKQYNHFLSRLKCQSWKSFHGCTMSAYQILRCNKFSFFYFKFSTIVTWRNFENMWILETTRCLHQIELLFANPVEVYHFKNAISLWIGSSQNKTTLSQTVDIYVIYFVILMNIMIDW